MCAQSKQIENQALKLDGKDNNVRIGMDIIKDKWTIEAWIKGDDSQWKDMEVIIGGSEYSDINTVDNLPLVLKNGKLYNTAANILSPYVLDDQWHHVAATCDGEKTVLYIDGEVVNSSKTSSSIIVGAIGIHETAASAFGGLVDEVRIWTIGLDAKTLKNWMNIPINVRHPAFKSLKGYYNFDDHSTNEIYLNWVGKGHQSYHARNGRVQYYGKQPLAYTVKNSNERFKTVQQKQALFNAVTILSEYDAEPGSMDNQILKLRIAVSGDKNPLKLKSLLLNLDGTTNISDIDNIHVYYTGQTPKSETKIELFGAGTNPSNNISFDVDDKQEFILKPGINYILVTFDINKNAQIGNKLKATIPSFKLGSKTYIPEESSDYYAKMITEKNDGEHVIKLLQWNIWHGGVHVGEDGQKHIIDLIRSTNADIITIQEGYGAQERIRDSLNYYLQTKSAKDNLALLSRFPITQIETKNPFKSNPAKITLPSGKKILVNDCWLRYAYRPEYTCVFPNTGLDPSMWIAEDSLYSLVDIKDIVDNDTEPYLEKDMSIIIAGDFNSCSYLDWTERTTQLHNGYGKVSFPTSIYMSENKFVDSYRELNPNELTHQGGTFAVILGQLQTSRIDFIYYKGNKIKATSSKTIRTSEEIDFVWAGDHAAVLTTFQILN